MAMMIAGLKYALSLPSISSDPFWRLEYGMQISLLGLCVAVCITTFTAPVLIFLRRLRVGLLCSVSGLVLFLWFAALMIMPQLDRVLSARVTSQRLTEMAGNVNTEILVCDVPRSYYYGYSYYLRREIPSWDRREPVKRTLVILGPICWRELKRNYLIEFDINLALWPVIEFKAPLSDSLPRSGQPQ
jgi:hypothetical protein